MKFSLSLIIIFLSFKASAKEPETFLLKKVLTDSIINKYMSNLCGIDDNTFALFHRSGNYLFNKGVVEFEEHKCDANSSFVRVGIIRKIKIKKTKAIVRIYFEGNDNFYAIVKFQRDDERLRWRVQSRFLYRNFQIPKKEPQFIYYSFN